MQSLANGMEQAGAGLFVRRRSDLPAALLAANFLLARRPRATSADDVLFILLHAPDGAPDSRTTPATPPSQATPRVAPGRDRVALREVAELAGIWSLRWFDLPAQEARGDADERRIRLLDHLLAADCEQRLLLPVFTRPEAREGGAHFVERLSARYPGLVIGPQAYVHDDRKLLPLPARHLTHRLRLIS